jgi:hypothetical protein
VLIGLDGSPSCGVHLTGSSGDWRGHPSNIEEEGYPVVEGRGVLMQEMFSEHERRGLPAPPAFGVGLDIHGIDLETLAARFREELDKAVSRF